MKKYNIAVLPGDGVGIETVAETVRLLRDAQNVVGGFELDLQHYDVSVGQYLKIREVITDEQYRACEAADAILLGALGTPEGVTTMVADASGTEVSGHAMFKLRFGLDLFAGVRPVKLYPNVPTTLSGRVSVFSPAWAIETTDTTIATTTIKPFLGCMRPSLKSHHQAAKAFATFIAAKKNPETVIRLSGQLNHPQEGG